MKKSLKKQEIIKELINILNPPMILRERLYYKAYKNHTIKSAKKRINLLKNINNGKIKK